MAKHLRGSGFGLRQVYDIAAFSLKEENNMNMVLFEEKARICNGLDFSVAIFKIINQIFNLNLFRGILDRNQGHKCNLNLLLEEILSYDIFKEDERKISLSKITSSNTNLLSKQGMHKEYQQLKRDISNIFEDDNIKRIINRRRILLNEFSL